jgi:tetratricopeptide (TPR) repeat protein
VLDLIHVCVEKGLCTDPILTFQSKQDTTVDPKVEKNATFHGLGHPKVLQYQPERVSLLCLRSAYLHMGNALSALGRNEEAREVYAKVLPMLDDEPRCGRLDWERCSVLVNIGNTFGREGNFKEAEEYYIKAEQLGKDHLAIEGGNHSDGYGLVIEAMRARSFALKRDGKDDEAKAEMRKVLETQMKKNDADEKMKALSKKLEEIQKKEEESMMATAKDAANHENTVALAVQ